jgi:phage terminase large subunit-like protein
MVECRQGFKTLSEPSKLIEADVTSGRLRHMHNPLLRWCAANAVVLSDPAGNIKPDKSKASERIDGIVALIMARSRAIIVKDDDEGAYEERGFLSL